MFEPVEGKWVTVDDQSQAPTAKQVHNGLVVNIAWIQLIRRRLRAGRLDLVELDNVLARVETLAWDTERKYSQVHHHPHRGQTPDK
jgi:hypothetical protein